MSVYLDYNATAPIRPEAKAAVVEAMETLGNPSSIHAAGRTARALVETARAHVATLVGVRPGSLTFTSGGTEANALAIQSAVLAGYSRIVVGATEHSCIKENAKVHGASVEVWPVDANGVADLDWLKTALERPGKALVCLMHANNETGVVQPTAQASDLVRAAGGWLHIDAVGSAGKLFVDFALLGADTLSVAAHKIGGPFGVGALAAGERSNLSRVIHGGGQEQGRRAGTENVIGIAGFAASAQAATRDLPAIAAQAAWRDAVQNAVEADGAVVFGKAVKRLPQTLNVAMPGFEGGLQVMNLDLAGVMVSAGSACASGKVNPSATIAAMGREDLAGNAIRISGGWATTEADWQACAAAWREAVLRHKARRKELA